MSDKPATGLAASEPWLFIEPVLDTIMHGNGIASRDVYLDVYTRIGKYMDAPTPSETKQQYKHMRESLAAYMSRQTRAISERILQTAGDHELVHVYLENWKQYQCQTKTINGLFRQIDAEWTLLERCTDPAVAYVPEMLLQCWCQMFAGSLGSHMTRILCAALESNSMDIVDKLKIAYLELAPNSASVVARQQSCVPDVYCDFFEQPCIQIIVNRIQTKMQYLQAPNTISAYVESVCRHIETDADNARQYLIPESIHNLHRSALLQLIVQHLQKTYSTHVPILDNRGLLMLNSAFEQLYNRQIGIAWRSLDGIFTSCLQIDVHNTLAQHTNIEFNSAAPIKIADISCCVVEQLARVHSLYGDIINYCLDGAPAIHVEFVRVFQTLVNSHAIQTHTGKPLEVILVNYCNSVLKPKPSNCSVWLEESDIAVDLKLKRALSLINLCQNKIFLYELYYTALGRRLLQKKYILLEVEQDAALMLINTLAQTLHTTNDQNILHSNSAQGALAFYAEKYKSMISDINTSRIISGKFAQQTGFANADIYVLSKQTWPARLFQSPPSQSTYKECGYLRHFINICEAFSGIYAKQHPQRTLLWQLSCCRVRVQFYFPDTVGRYAQSGYTFVLNLIQYAILELFTDPSNENNPAFACLEISAHTHLPVCYLEPDLNTLLKAGILLSSADRSDIRLNVRYSSKHKFANLSQIKAAQRQREENETIEYVKADQLWYLQSDIAWLLKQHKTFHYTELFNHISHIRQGIFSVDAAKFKTAVEKTIEKNIIERDKDNYQVLKYVAST